MGRTEELHSILLSIPLSAFNSMKLWVDCAGGEKLWLKRCRDKSSPCCMAIPEPGTLVLLAVLLLTLEAAEPCGDPLCWLRAQRVAGISGGGTEPCTWGIPWKPHI